MEGWGCARVHVGGLFVETYPQAKVESIELIDAFISFPPAGSAMMHVSFRSM